MLQEFKTPKTRRFDVFGLLGKMDYKKSEMYLRDIERTQEATKEYLKYLETQRRAVIKYRLKKVVS